MKNLLLILSIIMLSFACSENKDDIKDTEKPGAQSGDTVEITYNEDCAKYRDVNAEKCYEVLLPMFNNDSLVARSYCNCVYDKMLEEYSCEEIMKLKRMPPEEQEKMLSKIKSECKNMIIEKYDLKLDNLKK